MASTVLLTNDDGIYAPGLWALARALIASGEKVVVVAPDREQSGVGTSVSLHNPLRINRPTPPIPDVETYSVEGTPADSVILALGYLFKGQIGMVLSGINEGANLGNDVYISGTVGAAFQAHFYSVPSVAISVTSLTAVSFEPAAKLGMLLTKIISFNRFPPNLLLNVNLPNQSLYELQGIEVTRLARRTYADVVQEGWDGKRKYYWIVRGKSEWEDEEGSDTWAIRRGLISVTTLGNHPAELRGCLQRIAFPIYIDLLTAPPLSYLPAAELSCQVEATTNPG